MIQESLTINSTKLASTRYKSRHTKTQNPKIRLLEMTA